MKNLKYKFLFIDDSEIDNSYIKMLIEIEDLPIEAHYCPSAIDALAYLQLLEEATFPQVIVVDINMPLMNGFEFVEKFKKDFYPKYPKTKLYISSSTRRISEIEKSRRLKIVEDFIAKPVSSDFFVENVFPMIPKKDKMMK